MLLELSKFWGSKLGVNYSYIYIIIITSIVLLIFYFIRKLGKWLISSREKDRRAYRISKAFNIFVNILEIVVMFFVWEDYIKSIITLISLLSAAIALALRDIILNFFCGIYINIKKPFRVEDRILVDDIKGDVMNISLFDFEILEVNNDVYNGQSTGVVVTMPNSVVVTKSIKNLTKGFKYIWSELVVRIDLDCDLVENKKELYKIVNNIEIIKNIPKKMKQQINDINATHRIYYNNYEPMIYTTIVKDHVELSIRYLIHPKKARFVESVIWNKIFMGFKDGKINLYRGVVD